jgi:hypothetical protein
MPPPVKKELWLTPLRRVFGSRCGFLTVAVLFTVVGLGGDRFITTTGKQAFLGLIAAVLLVLSLVWIAPAERMRAVTVVLVATFFEVIGSVIWGVYRYRLGNLPLLVPPGHGLVYLAGLRISQFPLVRAHATSFVRAAVGLAVVWAVVGLTGVLGRVDAAGAFGVVVLSLALLRGRIPTVYAGVFLFVSFLEIYGTAVGTWRWAADIPGLGIPDGNPPSGVASGYVLFDVCAVCLAPWLLMWVRTAVNVLRRPLVTLDERDRGAGDRTLLAEGNASVRKRLKAGAVAVRARRRGRVVYDQAAGLAGNPAERACLTRRRDRIAC